MKAPNLNDLNKNTITKKYISAHYPEFYQYITEHYPSDLKWTEKLYWFYHGLTNHPKCIVCGKPVRFVNIYEGYKQYCSMWCSYKSEAMKEKRRQTCIKKYGVDNPTKNRKIVEKSMNTQRERYGGVGFESKELTDKAKQTNLERFGVEHPMHNEEVKEKLKQTNIERYGVEHPWMLDSVKEKLKQTNLERYGVENPGGTEESQKKIKQTNMERYGVENPMHNEEVKEKLKQTNLKRYGVENPGGTEESQKKIKQTNLERYGVESYSKTNEFKEKFKQTNLERYGVEYYTQTEEYKQKSYQTKKANHSFNTSQIEEDFASWLTEHNINFKRQYRSEKYPFACDFYFPDTDLYLEIQGTWTHGGHPFDPNNKDDIEYLQLMESKHTDYYDNAIEVWTQRDPLKRQIAKENNLNWIEVFTNDLDVVVENFTSYYLYI